MLFLTSSELSRPVVLDVSDESLSLGPLGRVQPLPGLSQNSRTFQIPQLAGKFHWI